MQEPPVESEAFLSPRIQRTRSALRDALAAEILATGELGQVTVTAVSDRAGITRRTFYSHYRDIADLVFHTEDEAIRDLRPYVARISEVHLEEVEEAIAAFAPIPGAIELLTYCADRGSYLAPLLGDGGDPAFAERIKRLVREVVEPRALEGFNPGVGEALFDYYLTFAISAEVGVLVRWLTTGMHESADVMARVMTALAFVRPGDLYGKPIDFDVPTLALALAAWRKGDQR